MTDIISRALSKMEDVQAESRIALDAIHLLQNPTASVEAARELIEGDPQLSKTLLLLADLGFYGESAKTDSIKGVCDSLGAHRLFLLTASGAVFHALMRPLNGYSLTRGKLWEHSFFVGVAAGHIARIRGFQVPDHMLAAGLLHDIGKIALAEFLEVDSGKILQMALDRSLPFDAAEAEVLGVNHAEVGAAVLRHWRLPSYFAVPVRWHHDPDALKGESMVTEIIHAADMLSFMAGVGIGVEGLTYAPAESVVHHIGLTPLVTEKVLCATEIDMEHAKKITAEMGME